MDAVECQAEETINSVTILDMLFKVFSFPAAGHLHSWREIWARRFSKKKSNWLLFCT